MYYGQHGEDKIIETFFKNKNNGVSIEVGAYDGISGSNTIYFEKLGWRVLCIEPNPQEYEKCMKVRKECYNCCIGEQDREDIEFNIFHLGNNTSAISSLVPDERLIKSHKHLITGTSTCKVKVRSLTSLLEEINFPKEIDFVSIDTENTELDVLKGFDLTKYNVKLLVIENNFNESFLEDYLVSFGYKKVHRLGVNDFYLKE